ncbi:MAG: FHA domain-containing protein [Clostridia bacterium]|nr:FHA domain-containing protein [Clostridia bacterium]
MYAIISDILKYAFVVVIYIFIYSVVKLVYLDISDARRMNKAEDDGYGYLKLINLRKDLSCRVFESYSLRESSVIGRSRKCDIYINNPYLSKEHARISFEDGKFYIEDLKSTNGTYLNGNKLGTHPVKLKDNDKISFGDISFLFVDGGVAIG